MSFEKIILQCLMYWLVYFIGSNNCEDVLPVISVQAAHSWDYSQSTNDSFIFHNKTVVIIPSSAKMCVLSCSAPYPVTWIIHDQARASDSWTLGLRAKRTAVNIFDTTTFSYSADLSFYPHSENPWTGNYTCRSVAKEDLRASKFLFWEGSMPLLHAYKNLTIYVEDGMAVFPCMVANLKVKQPTLQKRNGTDFRNLDLSAPNLSYDISKGFTLMHAENLTGQYKCIIDGQKEYINFDVKYYNETFAPSTKDSKASFKYDPVKKSLICCSNTKRSPKLMNYYCNHPSICDFKSLFTVPPTYPIYNRKSGKNCTKLRLYSYSAGVAHCLGDGIDMVKQYAFPIKNRYYWSPPNQTQPAYMQWNEIIPAEMITMNFHYERQRYPYRDPYYTFKRRVTGPIASDPLYDGDRVIFTCEASTYYFAEGVRWSIKWKNQTLSIINSTSVNTQINNYYFHDSSSSTPVTLHLDMESIICIAPVWNTSEYFFKPYHVYINASKPTVLRGDNVLNESLTWTLNDTSKSIVCEAEGIPIPEFTWTKSTGDLHLPVEVNSANITSEVNNVTHVITETLVVHRVSYNTPGVYTCTASNSGASVARVVTVTVEEPASWKKSVAITVGIVLVLALGVGLGLLYYKMRADKKVIKELTNTVGFANASNQEEVTADNDNSRYDAPKIHSNLLN